MSFEAINPGIFNCVDDCAMRMYPQPATFADYLLLSAASIYEASSSGNDVSPDVHLLLKMAMPFCTTARTINGRYRNNKRDLCYLLNMYAELIDETLHHANPSSWFAEHVKLRLILLCTTGLQEYFTLDGFGPNQKRYLDYWMKEN